MAVAPEPARSSVALADSKPALFGLLRGVVTKTGVVPIR